MTVSGVVMYAKRDCFTGASRTPTPVPDATVEIDRSGLKHAIPITLGSDGKFIVKKLSGSGPIRATLVLEGWWGAEGVPPRRIPFPKELHAGKQINEVLFSGSEQTGPINVWVVLDAGARFARQVSPIPIHKLTACLGCGPHEDAPHFSHDTWKMYIPTSDSHYEWEPWPLLHEYGHALDWMVAAPYLEYADATHVFNDAYPDRPGLAWNEGFGNAFAAFVLGTPHLGLGCQEIMNLAAIPATPHILNAKMDYAQYSETPAGAIIWGVATELGQGDRPAGLAKILGAMRGYRIDGHPVQTLRDFRDLLLDTGLEQDINDEHIVIEKIFAQQLVSWGIVVTIADDPNNETPDCAPPACHGNSDDIHLKLTGPYGTCEDPVTGSGDRNPQSIPGLQDPWEGGFTQGGSVSTWLDYCLIYSGTSNYQQFVGGPDSGVLNLFLPYLGQGSDRQGRFTLTATYNCTDSDQDPCLGSRPYVVHVYHGWGVGAQLLYRVYGPLTDGGVGGGPLTNTTHADMQRTISLPRGQETPIVTFTSTGDCTIANDDCGV